jgi:hypothetical protein
MNGLRNSTASTNLGSGDGNSNTNLPCLPSLCRGIYNRVARKLGCDPSYVSRVARGERNSEAVSEALRAEVQQTWALANGNAVHPAPRTKRKSR